MSDKLKNRSLANLASRHHRSFEAVGAEGASADGGSKVAGNEVPGVVVKEEGAKAAKPAEKSAEEQFADDLPPGPLKDFFKKYADLEDQDEKDTKRRMRIFLIIVLVAICVCGIIAFFVQKSNDANLDCSMFMNGRITALSVIVGMVSGLVFGFIDNAGLFFGMDYLDPVFSKLPSGAEPLVNAGYGNTFSDMIGAFMGTFCGKIIEEIAKKSDPELNDYPIWTEAVGITIGCLIGVGVPRKIKEDPDTGLLNESLKKAGELGLDLDEINKMTELFDDLDERYSTKKGMVPVSVLQRNTSENLDECIREADVDGNGWVQKGEVVFSYLKKKVHEKRVEARAVLTKQGPVAV